MVTNMPDPSLTSSPSLVICENTSMENTADSNSESDISENWSVIDDDSPLEWENDIQYHLRGPSSRSKYELSDEDSIEVVPDDHADSLCKDVEIASEEWHLAHKVESLKDIDAITSSTELQEVLPLQCKGNAIDKQHKLILIIILTLSIVGGLLGYLWVFNFRKAEESPSISSSRALVTKLQFENQFLRSKLRLAHSSLQLAVPKIIPKLNLLNKQIIHVKNAEKKGEINNFKTSLATHFMINTQTCYVNYTRDYCLPSDRGNALFEYIWTDNANNNFNSHLEIKHGDKVGVSTGNVAVQYEPHDINKYKSNLKQIDQKLNSANKKSASAILVDNFQHDKTHVTRSRSETDLHGGNQDRASLFSEDITDPRPYTKVRSVVDRIYALVALYSNGSQNVLGLPPKLKLLNTLSQNLEDLNALLTENTPTSIHEKVTSFKMRLQDATEKLFDDIDASIDKLIENIAFKVQESQSNTKKQFCNLKNSFKSDCISTLDLNTISFFQKCNEDSMKNENAASEMGDSTNAMKDSLSGDKVLNNFESIKEESVIGRRVDDTEEEQHEQTSDDKRKRKFEDFKRENADLQPVDARNGNIDTPQEPIDVNSVLAHGKSCESEKKSRKRMKSFPKHKTKDASVKGNVQPDNSTASTTLKYKHKKDHSDKELRKKRRETRKNKSDSTGPEDDSVDKNERFKKNKNNYNKTKSDKPLSKIKKLKKSDKFVVDDVGKPSDISGEWAIKMARGRAEHRRRDHQSDWMFDRAQLRKSNRGKTDNRGSEGHKSGDYFQRYSGSDTRDKNTTLKDRTEKYLKEKKLWMKDNLMKPLMDTAKSAKKVFNKFNNKMRHHIRSA